VKKTAAAMLRYIENFIVDIFVFNYNSGLTAHSDVLDLDKIYIIFTF